MPCLPTLQVLQPPTSCSVPFGTALSAEQRGPPGPISFVLLVSARAARSAAARSTTLQQPCHGSAGLASQGACVYNVRLGRCMSPRATPGPFVLYRQDGCTGPVRRQDVCAAWKGPAGAPAHVLRAPCYRVLYACLCNIHLYCMLNM